MFEAAELGRTVTSEEYRRREPALREELLDAQVRLRDAPFPVIVVFAGVDGAGKGETVNLLDAWLDPRWVLTRAFGPPSDEEQERPEFWRYWLNLPRRGRIGLYLSSWYSRPVLDFVYERTDVPAFDEQLTRIREFEQTLVDDGSLVLKFWMHLDKASQKKRLTKLEKDPLTRWRVTKLEWKHWKMYPRFVDAAERAIRATSRADSPWIIVEGADAAYRSLMVGSALRDAIGKHLAEWPRYAPRSRRSSPSCRSRTVRPDDPQPPRYDAAPAQESRVHGHRARAGPLEPAASQGRGAGVVDRAGVRRMGCRG